MLSRPTPVPSDLAKRRSLEGEINALLLKGAVRIVPRSGTQTGFMSTFFLTPKKEAGVWRPILNLKPLNKFIRPKRFRMETLRTILSSIVPPAWAASIDLKDAYLHVPVRPEHHKFLRSHLSGCVSRPAQGIGPPFGGTPTEPSAVRFSLPPSSGGPSAGLAQTVGPYGQHGGFGGLLQVEDEAHPTSPALLLQAHSSPNPPPGADNALASPPPSLVASRCEHLAGPGLSSAPAVGDRHDRRVTPRLGGNPPPASNRRRVGFRTPIGPHQCPGNVGSLQRTTAFPVGRQGPCGSGEMRQRHSRGLHQSPGGHPVGSPVCTGLGPHPLVHTAGNSTISSVHSGRRERHSRRSLKGLDCPHGVVPSPTGGSVALPLDRPTTRGPVRLPCEPPVADLLRKGPRPQRMEDRRSISRVGRPTGLCIPTHLTRLSGSDQDRARGLPGPSHSPVLAPATVVPTTHQVTGPPSGDPTRASGSPVPAQFGDGPFGSGGSSPDVLGAVTRSLRSAGLSQRAATIAAQSRRASTRKVYNSRLRHFFKWCGRESLHPTNTSVGEVGDFLVYLLDSGLTTGTVKNYRSAVAAIHPGFPDGSTVSDNGALSQLIKGMFVTRPPERKLVPSWDLFDVLSTLAGPPYEPMDCSTLLQLSVKLAFLLAVATSRRRSELHALSVETGHIRWEPGGVRLVPTTGFLTKNQSSSFTPPDIFVPDIKSFSSEAKDKLWCPVRALKWYLNRTKSLRTDHKKLFVTTTPPFRPASQCTISRWIVTAIRSVPGGWPATENTVRAHDVRGVSASWAFFKGVPLADITKAACWKCPNTFSDLYLKDVLQTDGRAGREVLKTASQASQKH
ncbi:uncharacterized protein LOC117295606 [Asterias rubens]|uniref:uncharacterized protein LOC117295606 n=1 Tax=Asterias rubens TaxID=7604 RepID=UPI001455CEF5|nr:uncharacterized protein LOC117295606 [Asterias rubens]